MNIFQVDSDPRIAAKLLVDKHVVKMILETCQLLSTAHRVIDGVQVNDKSKTGRNVKRWILPDGRNDTLYAATHINHPSSVWVRQSNNNYNWLYAHLVALLAEYTYRYNKVHKCAGMVDDLRVPPFNIPLGPLTQATPAMPDEYKVLNDSVASYRNYYNGAKQKLFKWTKRSPPEWIKYQSIDNLNEI